jgi:serine/threonine-protein kinase
VNAASTSPIGVIAHYNLLERLEPSGPGDVYRARDTHHGRTVAIRLLPAEYAARPESRQGAIAEARARIALSHPNITALFDAGEHEGRVFFAFEFARGRSLSAEVGGRPMQLRRALELAVQLSDAAALLHAAGFTHRGLSPESVIVTEKGHAKIPASPLATLIGFDPAKGGLDLHDRESPEEARGESADERSDVYSVGAIVYEMLTARVPPLRGASAPSSWNARVPKELDEVLLKALAPNPASRTQSAAALAADLRAVAVSVDTRDAMDQEEAPAGDPQPSRAPMLAAAAILIVAALALAWYFTRS